MSSISSPDSRWYLEPALPMDAHLDGFTGYLPSKDACMNGIYRAAPILGSETQRTGNNPVTDTHELQRAHLQLLLQHRMRPFPLLLHREGCCFCVSQSKVHSLTVQNENKPPFLAKSILRQF